MMAEDRHAMEDRKLPTIVDIARDRLAIRVRSACNLIYNRCSPTGNLGGVNREDA